MGPVSIIEILPKCETVDYGGPWTKNGSELNPGASQYQGYDSRSYLTDRYRSAKNVALGVSTQTPLIISCGSTLVSTISQSTPDQRPQLKSASVLTILASAAAAGDFRPALTGTDKTVKYNVSDLERGVNGFSYLSELTPVAGAPLLADVERWFERPWTETQIGWWAEWTHPSDNFNTYGRELSNKTAQATLMLNLDLTGGNPQLNNHDLKRTLLIRLVQLGIDCHGVITSGKDGFIGRTMWWAEGGQYHGRKLPIMVAAIALNDTSMKNMFAKTGAYLHSFTDKDGYPKPYGPCHYGNYLKNPPDMYYFQEDEQVYYITKFHVDATNSTNGVSNVEVSDASYVNFPLPNRDNNESNKAHLTGYTMDDIGLPEWSMRPHSQPETSIAGPNWPSANYRSTAGSTHPAIALAVHIMGLKTLWNNPALFDYADRYMRMIEDVDHVWGIKKNPSDPDWPPIELWQDSTNGVGTFVRNMWSAYRADYGPSWKPSPELPDWPVLKFQYGDVSGDSALSAYDAALAARIAVGLDAYPTGDNLTKTDVSGDGFITAYDAALIAQKAVGLISKFPVES